MWREQQNALFLFYALIKHGFFDQSERVQGPIYIIKIIRQRIQSCSLDTIVKL